MSSTSTSRIQDLTTETEWATAHTVLLALRPNLSLNDLLDRREPLIRRGYRLLGLFDQETLVAVAGIQVLPHILRDQELRVHDLATHPAYQSRGFGERLMSHVYVLAKNENCSRVLLYSRTANVRAHHFYERCGFAKLGFELGYEIREE